MQAGGAKVTLAGFTHGVEELAEDTGTKTISLGNRNDGQLWKRAKTVAIAIPKLMQLRRRNLFANIIVARNIEMLFLAFVSNRLSGKRNISIVYECLDIHRMQLGSGLKSRALRWLEGTLIKRSSAIVTSSPSFITNYFNQFENARQKVLLVENKLLEVEEVEDAPVPLETLSDESLWKIGWFGTLRCKQSLLALSEFSSQRKNQFKIVLRGKPALSVHDDFFDQIKRSPNVEFLGRYRNPEDVGAIYRGVNFSWLIDFYEEGQNSKWLLPNRLYEGCRFGAVPIALSGTETARFLEEHEIGIILPDAEPETIASHLAELTPARYADLRNSVVSIHKSMWSHSKEDSLDFVRFLTRLSAGGVDALETEKGALCSGIEVKP